MIHHVRHVLKASYLKTREEPPAGDNRTPKNREKTKSERRELGARGRARRTARAPSRTAPRTAAAKNRGRGRRANAGADTRREGAWVMPMARPHGLTPVKAGGWTGVRTAELAPSHARIQSSVSALASWLAPTECSISCLCPSSFGSARVSCPGLRFVLGTAHERAVSVTA